MDYYHNHIYKKATRLGAAGLAGVLCAAGTAGALPAYAAGTIPAPASASGETGNSFLSESQPLISSGLWGSDEEPEQEQEESRRSSGSGNWDEKDILDRWDLDGKDFARDEEESVPVVPDDLLPYFQEMTADAIAWYAGKVPPQADLKRYSTRADQIKDAVRTKAVSIWDEESGKLLTALRQTADVSFSDSIGKLTASLQRVSPANEQSFVALAEEAGTGSDLQTGQKRPFLLPLSREEEDKNTALGHSTPMQRFLDRKEQARNAAAGATAEASAVSASTVQESTVRSAEQPDAEEDGINDSGTNLAFQSIPSEIRSLPVPPGLYDFSLMFPASENRMATRGGTTLFPGLSHFVGLPPEPVPEEGVPVQLSSPGTRETVSRGPAPMVQRAEHFSKPRKTVFVGDSRTVGMEMYVDALDNEYWSARNSMGYSWMVSTGVPQVEDLIDKDTDVIILMGVNDLGNLYNYADYINEKAADWKELGARTFFVSVNPVDDSRSPNAKNYRIENFNSYMQRNLQNVHYIDTYSRIRNSFSSPDGIHFSGSTYQEIYRIIHFYTYRGWYEEAGLRFYFDLGRPLTGWQYLDGKWQYMDGSGVRWISSGRSGDICLAPYPDTSILDPYQGVLHSPVQYWQLK